MATDNNQRDEQKPTDPIRTKEDVQQNPDPKIDSDHPGFPHAPSDEKQISPKTSTDKKTAAVDITDGEKKDSN
jgi:hypothetical protein